MTKSNNINEKFDLTPIINACKTAASLDLFKCSSGNISYRLDDSNIALSASGAWLADITPGQIAICQLKDGKSINNIKPTIESNFHLGILQNRPDVNVVLHFQSQYATAIACGNPEDCNFNVIIEVPFYIGKPATVQYLRPGSKELANAVIEKAKTRDMIIMKNHGLVTVGKDFKDTIQKAAFFELACKILLTQPNPTYIKDEDVENLTKSYKAKK